MEYVKRGKSRKSIKKILDYKLKDWLKSIKDPRVQKLASLHTIVTGGCISSMLLGEEVKDFDIYFTTRETALAVAKYYVKEFNELNPGRKNKLGYSGSAYVLDCSDSSQVEKEKAECKGAGHLLNIDDPERIKIVIRSDGVASQDSSMLNEPFEDVFDVLDQADQTEVPTEASEKYKPVFLSSNAITLSDKIQIVIRFFGTAEEIHKNYDFVHCTNSYELNKKELTLRPEAMEALMSRELRYQGSKYPLCSVIRTRKFLKRGWNINAGQYLKMCFQISNLDLTDLNVLEDQLVGVDSAYFMQVIQALQHKQNNDPNFNVDSSYLTTIIDKIF